MKKRRKTLRGFRRRSIKLKTLYNKYPESRDKLDVIIDLLYKIICKASTGNDSKDSITIDQLCGALYNLGFEIYENEIVDTIWPFNNIREVYGLELIHTEGGTNVEDTHFPPVKGSGGLDSLDSEYMDREVLKRVFLTVGLNVSTADTIY